MKKFLALLCSVILMVSMLISCAEKEDVPPVSSNSEEGSSNLDKKSSESTGDSSDLLPGEPTEVIFWHSMGGNAQEALEDIVEDYNNSIGKDKGVTITPIFQGAYDEASTKLAAVMQSDTQNELPDIMQLSSKGIFDVKDSKYIIPVQDMVNMDPDGIELEKLSPNAVQYAMYQDKMLGLPFSNSSIMLYYNKDHFKDAGLDPEAPPKTIEELATVVDALTVRDGNRIERYGIGVKLRFFLLGTWIPMQGEGKYIFNEEDGRTGTPTEVAMTKDGTLKTLLVEWDKVLKTGGVEFNDASPREGFQSELYSMMPASTSSMRSVTTSVVDEGLFDLGVAELPRVNQDCTTGTGIGGSAIYLFDRGDENSKLGAWDYMKYIATPEASAKWFMQTGYYPLNMKAEELPEVQELLETQPQFNLPFTILKNSANYPKYLEPWIPSFTDIDTIVQNEIIKFSEDKQDVDTTVNNIDSLCKQRLDDWISANE